MLSRSVHTVMLCVHCHALCTKDNIQVNPGAEEWRFEGIHSYPSYSISTPQSANTRAVNPLNFGKMGPPFIPSEEG